MDRNSRHSQGKESVWFGNLRFASLLFADDMVLLASSVGNLQHVLGQFAIECEAAEMIVRTFKSEAMVLCWKTEDCYLLVGGELLPQAQELKYLRSCL